MSLVTSVTTLPGNIDSQSALRPTQLVRLVKHTTSKDSVCFGANQTDGPASTPAEESGFTKFLHNTPGVRTIYAGLKGLVQGAFEGPWNKYLGRGAGWLGALLPFALIIPGPHWVILPGYVLVKRAIAGLRQMITGFKDPDKILKPQPVTNSTTA